MATHTTTITLAVKDVVPSCTINVYRVQEQHLVAFQEVAIKILNHAERADRPGLVSKAEDIYRGLGLGRLRNKKLRLSPLPLPTENTTLSSWQPSEVCVDSELSDASSSTVRDAW